MWLKNKLKEFKRNGVFNLSSGGVSEVYFDLKEAFGNPELLNCIANNLYTLVDKKPDFVAARGLGGVTLATAISLKHGINLTLVRDKQKDYGTCRLIEGYAPKQNDSGIIVDDVFTVGTSLKKSIDILKPTGAQIIGCYTIVKRGEGELSVPLHYLYTLEDLI